MELKGQMQVTSWQEDELRTIEREGGKVTRARVGYRITGDIEGEAIEDLVMCYRPDGTATAVGLWEVTGLAAGRTGSVMFESSGGYDGTRATAQVRTVPGSATGDLADARGTGTTSATQDHVEYILTLEL